VRQAFAIAFVISGSVVAMAQQTDIGGIGAMPCSDAISMIDRQDFKSQLFHWSIGYLSGVNSGLLEMDQETKQLRSVSIDTVAGDVYSYCARNSDSYIVEALKRVYLSLPTL